MSSLPDLPGCENAFAWKRHGRNEVLPTYPENVFVMRPEPGNVSAHYWMAVGRVDGTAILVFMLLAQRFGPVTEEAKARLKELNIFELRDVAERLLTAQTLNEALDVERWGHFK